jgi:predicted small integral membrane protein
MLDTALLLAQLLTTASLAAWLTSGVWDNIFHPTQNEVYTSQVMSMERIREDYPDAFEPVKHRAITDRKVQLAAFRLVVLAELIAAMLLWIGTGALLLALFGGAALETARALALLGCLAFTCVWSVFLVAGNYFSYWFGHEGAQNTHYQMTLWGIGVMILLVQG